MELNIQNSISLAQIAGAIVLIAVSIMIYVINDDIRKDKKNRHHE